MKLEYHMDMYDGGKKQCMCVLTKPNPIGPRVKEQYVSCMGKVKGELGPTYCKTN